MGLKTDILLMDEPFAALDEQTRMVLGEDLSELLARTGKTIVFVTHSLVEAVFLADRVAVFSARPGRIKEVIAVEEGHPRSRNFMTSDKLGALAQPALRAACTTRSARPWARRGHERRQPMALPRDAGACSSRRCWACGIS